MYCTHVAVRGLVAGPEEEKLLLQVRVLRKGHLSGAFGGSPLGDLLGGLLLGRHHGSFDSKTMMWCL